MVYGPIAAMLVEMFSTRIRYTSMSLPYHIGNGWSGGLLPATGVAIVAQTGNMYNGLYPIIVAAGTFVIGMLFVKETKRHRYLRSRLNFRRIRKDPLRGLFLPDHPLLGYSGNFL